MGTTLSRYEYEQLLEQIAKQITHIYDDEMTTSEKKIAKLLEDQGLIKKHYDLKETRSYTYVPDSKD